MQDRPPSRTRAPGETARKSSADETPSQPPSYALAFIVGAAFFMEGLDTTIVATSLPQIANSIDRSATELGVLMTSYLLSLSVFLPASGWMTDRYDARHIFLCSIAIFTLGSLICAISGSLEVMTAGRCMQGAGGAMMTPVGRLLLARSFPRDELVRAMSYMVIPGLMGPMLGPVVGGFITTHFSWRWIFLINLPIGALVFALGYSLIEKFKALHAQRFDFKGFILAGIMLAALQTALEVTANEQELTYVAAAAFGIFIIAALTLFHHLSRTVAPIFDLKVFRHRSFSAAVFGGAFSRLALGAILFLFPLLFQLGFGASPFEAGLLLGVLALGQMATRLIIDRLINYAGVKRTLVVNSVILILMLLGVLLLSPATPIYLIATYLFVLGLFHSVQLSTLAALNFSGLDSTELGSATSISSVAQRISMAIGISIAALVLGLASPGAEPDASAFVLPFVTIALLVSGSVAIFATLKPEDGGDLISKKPHRASQP
ncbi:MFS transporter [Hyphococcus luteus]|uniref:MFS transporter n=1 Tax=Hyphococcus luteus TaxID=2058213 RepID=A0A2S7K5B8_9PROT|nr:MFS transporter [Marinicaulis flavus]PQA87638.1 MFS transporter [Marinicaulis flavus]